MEKHHSMTNRPSRIVWFAVALGFLADQLISIAVGTVGLRFDPNLVHGATFATTAGAVTSILLVLSTGFGGWLAGRLAKHEYVLHGALVGGWGVILMLIFALFGDQAPLTDILLQFGAVAAGGLGGWLSHWIPTRQQ